MLHQIIWLRSSSASGAREFPYLESAAEGDQEDDWRWPLTSIERPEIVHAPILPDEVHLFEGLKPEQPGLMRFQHRVNLELGRDDLRVSWRCISAADWAKAPEAKAVWEFPKPPVQGYSDIYAPGEIANVISRESVEAFLENGGSFMILD